MPIALDHPNDTGKPEYTRDPDDFMRLGHSQGAPRVMSLTRTKQPTGKKADLQQQCRDLGLDGVGTIPVLKERLGPQPTYETYGRPSNYASVIDGDNYNLVKYKERQVALGIAMDPAVLERLQNIDPSDEKSTLDGIVARAHEVADSDLASARGTWTHSLTEWAESVAASWGPELVGDWSGAPQPESRFNLDADQVTAIARGWLNLLADNNLTVVASEAKVVNDDLRLAGSLDRIVRTGSALWFHDANGSDRLSIAPGEHVILDIKTSRFYAANDGTPSYWSKFGPQVEAYRAAVPYDVRAETRGEWPFTLDDKVALIGHLDVDHLIEEREARWQLVAVDLAVARQGIAAVRAALDYKASQSFAMPTTVTTVSASQSAAPSAPSDVEQRAEATAAPVTSAEPTRDELAARFHALDNVAQAECLDAVTAGLKTGDLAAVAAAIDAADPFAQPSPELQTARFTAPVKPDEGDTAIPGVVKAAQVAYGQLTVEQRSWLGALLDQANEADVPLGLGGDPSQRRIDCVSALICVADEFVGADDTDPQRADIDEMLRALLALVVGDVAQQGSVPIGALCGSLNAAEAHQFRVHAVALASGNRAMSITPDGRIEIEAAA